MSENDFLSKVDELYLKYGGSEMGQVNYDLFAYDLAELVHEFKGSEADVKED